ncbi:MAG: heme-binding domain-containing protein [Candidatus Korobacteraceae bacterium]
MTPVRIAIALGVMIAAVIALSTIHPWGDLRAAAPSATLLDGSAAPPNVRQVLEAKCADCHSENTHWPAYSRFAPASWLIERDVHDGRSHLNLSQWQHYSAEDQATLLNRIAAEVRSGQMPVKRYLVLHPQARLSLDEQQLVYDWAKAERKSIRHRVPQVSRFSRPGLLHTPASDGSKTPMSSLCNRTYAASKGRSFSCAVASLYVFVITRRPSGRRGICFSRFR